jgi:hypothetical protein
MFSGKTNSIALRDLPPLLAAAVLPLIPIVSHAGFLAALPLLMVMLPLLFGRFPGESVIERLAARARPRTRDRRTAVAAPRQARSAVSLLRSRLLIAASFAERPPPAPLLSS